MTKNITKYLPKYLKLFDVSLRDGLQSWKKIPTTDEKKNILHKISKLSNIKNVEVGSIVSNKIFPQFNDSIELYHYTRKKYNHINPFLLVPNQKMHKIALHNKIENMSFITSVSNEFQKKNINMDLDSTKKELINMVNATPGYKKLYISCVHECPISGVIDNNTIINEIIEYIKLPVNEICISDTCGTLTKNNLENILNILLPIMQFNNISVSKLSLHLHQNINEQETRNIINYCIEKYIYKFDVSYIDGGGCSVTMNEDTLKNNLNYKNFEYLI
jgi:isopropylmalate/homocitrate/citramalate synthase